MEHLIVTTQEEFVKAVNCGKKYTIGENMTRLDIQPGSNLNTKLLGEALKENNSITDVTISVAATDDSRKSTNKMPKIIEALYKTSSIQRFTFDPYSALFNNAFEKYILSACLKEIIITKPITVRWAEYLVDTLPITSPTVTHLRLKVFVSPLKEAKFENKFKNFFDGHEGQTTKYSKAEGGKDSRGCFTEYSIEGSFFKQEPPEQFDERKHRLQEFKTQLVGVCCQYVAKEVYPSTMDLHTKISFDEFACESLTEFLSTLEISTSESQKQYELSTKLLEEMTVKKEDLQKQLVEVDEKMKLLATSIEKQSQELSKSKTIDENLRKNIEIYSAAMKKNTEQLDQWKNTLQADMATWTKEDVSLLLQEIRLVQYSDVFVSNGIDGTVLQQLETTDLISALKMPFKDAKKLLMYAYLIQTHHDIYDIPEGVLQWNNDTVCRWLEDNKFGHLVDVFKKHEITGAELAFLEKADLAGQLEIQALGDVIKLQKEILNLKESIKGDGVSRPQGNTTNNNNLEVSELERKLDEVTRAHDQLQMTLKERETTVPEAFICPITQDIMQDPVVASDGYTYERVQIEGWLKTKNTSPMTGLVLPNKQLTPSHTLKSMIREFIDANKKK